MQPESVSQRCSGCEIEKTLDQFRLCGPQKTWRRRHCRSCENDQVIVRYREHKKRRNAQNKRWYEENKESRRATQRRWASLNKERTLAAGRRYRKKHPERDCAKVARRTAEQLRATPKWANEFFIEETYALASLRSKVAGRRWHVDHVVPLRSKEVCGLHVEHNLRVVLGSENQAKGNRYWPGMPVDIDFSERTVPMR